MGSLHYHRMRRLPSFLVAMCFTHKAGLKLKPRVFTDSTKNAKDPKDRIPSTSGKHHLSYFADESEFITAIMEYIKNEKLLGTYVGTDEGETIKGFYKYIFDDRIRPTYLLHRTVTGRSASASTFQSDALVRTNGGARLIQTEGKC